jgi:hypothetical protein
MYKLIRKILVDYMVVIIFISGICLYSSLLVGVMLPNYPSNAPMRNSEIVSKLVSC